MSAAGPVTVLAADDDPALSPVPELAAVSEDGWASTLVDVPDDDVLRVSLLGAGIALFGLMILAAAAGMRRGSGLSRLLVSVYLVIVVGLTVLVLADSRLSNLWATGVAVIGVVAIVLPWLPPASRFFSRLRD